MNPKLVLALVCVCSSPCWAQTAANAVQAPVPAERPEPKVQHTVIEDKLTKIDELNVRGQVQHVVVTPKVGMTKPYEIVPAPTGHDPFDGTGGARTGAGKRVWNVLNF